jgi:hypothetical protein
LEVTVAAQPDTRALRFLLDTVIGSKYDLGSVTYDDGVLVEGTPPGKD